MSETGDSEYYIDQGHILITLSCNLSCPHCLFSCGPEREWMSNHLIKKAVNEFYENNIKNVRIMGGEPFLNFEKFLFCFKILEKKYDRKNISTITSGFWATDEYKVKKVFSVIKGIKQLAISVDRFHQQKVPINNIKLLLKFAPVYEIEPYLMIMIDSKSDFFINTIIELINEFRVDFFVFPFDYKGRGELFETDLNKNFYELASKIYSNIRFKKINIKKNEDADGKKIYMQPSVFPSGNVYSCCDALKLTYMGNIKHTPLKNMIEKYKNSLPCFFQSLGCHTFPFLSPLSLDKCEICRNFPLKKGFLKNSNDWIGRNFFEIKKSLDHENTSKSHAPIFCPKWNRKNPLHRDNLEIVKKVEKLLKIKNSILSRPIPMCLQQFMKYRDCKNVPKNCFECQELFEVDTEGNLILCPNIYRIKINKKINEFKNREEIYNLFVKTYENYTLHSTCQKCIFFIRGKCNGLCFRKT